MCISTTRCRPIELRLFIILFRTIARPIHTSLENPVAWHIPPPTPTTYDQTMQIKWNVTSFQSFAVLSTVWAVAFEFIALIILHRVGFNYIPAGPNALLFSIVYQYSRIIPAAYNFRVFGVALNSKTFNYVLALQVSGLSNFTSLCLSSIVLVAGAQKAGYIHRFVFDFWN
jgi:hypothetical protein